MDPAAPTNGLFSSLNPYKTFSKKSNSSTVIGAASKGISAVRDSPVTRENLTRVLGARPL